MRALESRGDKNSEAFRFVRALHNARTMETNGFRNWEDVRNKRLSRVLRKAAKTELYQDRIRGGGSPMEILSRIEPVTKEEFLSDLQSTFVGGAVSHNEIMDFVRGNNEPGSLFQGKYIVAMTSGTTGQVGVFVNGLDCWARTRAMTFARIFQGRLGARDFLRLVKYRRYRMAFVIATGGHYMTYNLAVRVPPIAKRFVDARVHSVDSSISELVEKLNKQQPHYVHSYPTILELLCAETNNGRLHINPEMITSGSEPLTQKCRNAVKRSFPNADLRETYAATECVALASSCDHERLHINEDACVIEGLDSRGRPVPQGDLADHIVVTNLLNQTQPVVRYVLTDQLQINEEPCPCGSPFRSVEVHGRTDDTFFLHTKDGDWQAHPPIPLEIIFLKVDGLVQYKLVHESQNVLRVLFVADENMRASHVAAMLNEHLSEYLRRHRLSASVDFSIEQVEKIPRHSQSQKMRQIRSLVSKPEFTMP
jgi:phenylacetate-CoA ligase